MLYPAGGMTPVSRGMTHLARGVTPLAGGMVRAGMVVMQTEVQETQIVAGAMQIVREMPPVESGMSYLAP